MNYIDLGTTTYSKRYQKSNNTNHKWVRSTLFLITLVLALFGVKLLLQPITSALGSLWQQSGLVVSGILHGPRALKQDDAVTNFLLVGIDKRSYEPYSVATEQGQELKRGFLADTIIIASYNHQTQQVSLLSIPRDLYVKVPAFGQIYEQYTKINGAHSLGDQFDFEGGGMTLLAQILEEVLGVPIHYWARIDFEAFEKGIDAISGIDLEVENAFDDFMYPKEGFENAPTWEDRYEHIHFDQGLQYMDGATALKYARSRHALGVEGTDFARAKRQQRVILAVKNKVLGSETLFNLERLKSLYLVLSENINTNISLAELPLFYKLAQSFNQGEVKSYVLDGGDEPEGLLVSPNPEDFGGVWILIPKAGLDDYTAIQNFVRKIFY